MSEMPLRLFLLQLRFLIHLLLCGDLFQDYMNHLVCHFFLSEIKNYLSSYHSRRQFQFV